MTNYFQMPHFLWDKKLLKEVFNTELNVYQRVILTHIVRKTVGWGKTKDAISFSQFVSELNISKRKVIYVLQELESIGIIIKMNQKSAKGDDDPNLYEIHPSIIKKANQEKVVHGVHNSSARNSLPVVHGIHTQKTYSTKDTLTKALYSFKNAIKLSMFLRENYNAHIVEFKDTQIKLPSSNGVFFLVKMRPIINNGYLVNSISGNNFSNSDAKIIWSFIFKNRNQIILKPI